MATTTYKSTKIIVRDNLVDDSLLSVSVDKLFELYGNLVLAGFSESEAIQVVAKVVSNDLDRFRTN